MKYIEKNNQTAIDLNSDFIKVQWQTESNKYYNLNYSLLLNYQNFKNLLILEQDEMCCYCMKNIKNENITIEHYIPKKDAITDNEIIKFNKYLDEAEILRNNVVNKNIFKNTRIELNTPPFPHDIAYHNLLVSCNGKIIENKDDIVSNFCNNKRSDSYIPAFTYDTEIENKIVYNKDGSVLYKYDTDKSEYINTLNLNYSTLKKIRRLWFIFSLNSATDFEEIKNKVTLKERKHIINESYSIIKNKIKDDNYIKDTFYNEQFWNIFIKYKWFYFYYKTKYVNI